MSNTKKLVEMDRDELLAVCQKQAEILSKHKKLAEIPDLPPNREANDRHQRMKTLWGEKKARLLVLLTACLSHLEEGSVLKQNIEYELAHDEFLFQKKGGRSGLAKRRALKKAYLRSEKERLQQEVWTLQEYVEKIESELNTLRALVY